MRRARRCKAFLFGILMVSAIGGKEIEAQPSDVDSSSAVLVEREAYLMGTRLRASVWAPDRAGGLRILERAFAEVARLEDALSTWRPDSQLSRANRSLPHTAYPLTAELGDILEEAFRWSGETGGAFHPGAGALVDAWDLRGEGRALDEDGLAAALRATGARGVLFDPAARTLLRRHPAARVDEGAFGKGAALRAVASRLGREGVANALLDFGGQILALGDATPSETGWDAAIADPVDRMRPAVPLRLRDASAATSGGSERSAIVDGTPVSHIVDPRSGRPVPPWGSVTVVAKDALEADVLATALYVMGPDEGMVWAETRTDVGVLFLERDELGGLDIHANARMAAWLTRTDDMEP